MATPDEKLAKLVEEVFGAKVTFESPPGSSSTTEVEFISIKDVIRLVKHYFQCEDVFNNWCSRLAREVSEDGTVTNIDDLDLHNIFSDVRNLYIPFASITSLLEHPQTRLRALGETTPRAIQTSNGKQFNYLIQIQNPATPIFLHDHFTTSKDLRIYSCNKCGSLRKQLAYLRDAYGPLLDSGCLLDGNWCLVKVVSMDKNEGLATVLVLEEENGNEKSIQTKIISIELLRPIERNPTSTPFWAEMFIPKTLDGVMNGPAAKSRTWADLMSLHRRVLRLAASGNHCIVQVPDFKSEKEPDKAFPHVYFQENGSLTIESRKCFHVEQSYNPGKVPLGPLTPDEYFLKLFSKWNGWSVDSMVNSMKLALDLFNDVLETKEDETSWENAASGYIEARFNPQTFGQSGKLDEAREAAEKEGAVAIEMSWNVNCDMDIHCFFLTESGKFVKIFFSNPKYCVNCVAEEHASGTLRNCKCGPEYQIWLRLDHTSGPATELITVGKSVKGRAIFGAHVYSGCNREKDIIEVNGCIRASNGAKSLSPKLTMDKSKITKQLVFDGGCTTLDQDPNSWFLSEQGFEQHAEKILRKAGGLIFPDPLDLPFDKIEVTDDEREARIELLKNTGYDQVYIIPSIPKEESLVWQNGIGGISTKDCPSNLANLKDLTISINNPAVQPAMFGLVNLPEDGSSSAKSSQIFVLVSPGETVSGNDARPMPKGGKINATQSGATFEQAIFPYLFKNYPMLQVDKIFLVKNCFFCTFVVQHVPNKEEISRLSKFMGFELSVSPKVDLKILNDKKLRHAFGSHKFPVHDHNEFRTIGICIQSGWKIPIGHTESQIFIEGPPRHDGPTPWYQTPNADKFFQDAILDASNRRTLMEKITKICMNQKAFEFLTSFMDPTYPERTDGVNKILLDCHQQLASVEIPKNKMEMKSYCDKVWNDGKDPNLLLWVEDSEVKEIIEAASKMPATEGRKKIFTQKMISTALKPLEIRKKEKLRREQLEKNLKQKLTKHQEELARQEERFEARVQSALAVHQLSEEPRTSQGGGGGQICVVCMDQTVETVFNCGHASTCQGCSCSLDSCPICRSNITSVIRLYLSGRDD